MSNYSPSGGREQGHNLGQESGYGEVSKGRLTHDQANSYALWGVLLVLGLFCLVILLCTGVFAVLLLPSAMSAEDTEKQKVDVENMKKIGLALVKYHRGRQAFPSSFAVNSKGEKVWSWKVAILLELNEHQLYNRIDFQRMKSWDDPENQVLQGPSPVMFQSARVDHNDNPNEANVFLIASNEKLQFGNPMFIDGEHSTMQDCRDGTRNTMVAVMLAKHSAPWASPRNLTPEEAYELIKKEDRAFVGLFADGVAKRLSVNIDRESFMGLITRDAGEPTWADDFAP